MVNQSASTEKSKPRVVNMLENASNSPWLGWAQPFFRYLLSATDRAMNTPEAELASLGILTLAEYQGHAPRIKGFKVDNDTQAHIRKVSPYGIPTLPTQAITVFDERVYERWLKNNRQFNEDDHALITGVFTKLLETNGSGVLRRAIYNVHDFTIPNLPTYNNKVTAEKMMSSLLDLYGKYADQYGSPEFAKEVFCYPYIDPKPDNILNPTTAKTLPIGGIAYPSSKIEDTNGRITIVIKVGYGDSAIHNQGHPEGDEIIVHVDKPTEDSRAGTPYRDKRIIHPIKRKAIMQRQPPAHWHATPITSTDGSGSEFWSVPIGERVIEPTLPDNLAEAIAIHLANAMWLTGETRKIEFSMGPTFDADGNEVGYLPYILENVPFDPPELKLGREQIGDGVLTQILNNVSDLDHLLELIKLGDRRGTSPSLQPIVICTPQFIDLMRSDIEIRNALIAIPQKLSILASLNSTEHVARGLEEIHTVIPTTDEIIEEIIDKNSLSYRFGSRYHIISNDGIGMLVLIPENETIPSLPDILTIKQARLMGYNKPEEIGGKAYGLTQLDGIHYPVPENTLTLTSTFFNKIISANQLGDLFEKLDQVENDEELRVLFARIHQGLQTIPDELINQLYDRMVESGAEYFAFRSNLSIEDDGKHPMAGVFESILNVKLGKLGAKEALLKIIKGYFEPKVATQIFRDLSGNDRTLKLKNILGSVIVQPMIDSLYSGTLFSYDRSRSTEMLRQTLTLQVSHGVGGVVDGSEALTITRYRNGDIRSIQLNTKEGLITPLTAKAFKKLSDDDTTLGLPKYIIVSLLKLLKNAAKMLNDEQDMEWAVINDPETGKLKIIFLQTRPILTA